MHVWTSHRGPREPLGREAELDQTWNEVRLSRRLYVLLKTRSHISITIARRSIVSEPCPSLMILPLTTAIKIQNARSDQKSASTRPLPIPQRGEMHVHWIPSRSCTRTICPTSELDRHYHPHAVSAHASDGDDPSTYPSWRTLLLPLTYCARILR
jgi:hypothetical protein